MTFGLEVRAADGSLRLGTNDILHNKVAQGFAALDASASAFVSVSGMTASDEWLIILLGDAVAYPATGGFNVRTSYGPGQTPGVNYVVYRR